MVISILPVKPNIDLERDDAYVSFYHNRVDIFRFVMIDGKKFELPMFNENDFPHWGEDSLPF